MAWRVVDQDEALSPLPRWATDHLGDAPAWAGPLALIEAEGRVVYQAEGLALGWHEIGPLAFEPGVAAAFH